MSTFRRTNCCKNESERVKSSHDPAFTEVSPMQEKLNQLSLGEKLIAGGGLLMLIAGLFFDWWHYSLGGVGSAGTGGFDEPGSIWSTLAILISIVLAGIVVAVKFGNIQMPALPAGWTWGMIYGAGAALVVL